MYKAFFWSLVTMIVTIFIAVAIKRITGVNLMFSAGILTGMVFSEVRNHG